MSVARICTLVGVLLFVLGFFLRRRRAAPLIFASAVMALVLAVFVSPETSQSVVDGITWILDGGTPDDAGP